MNRATTRAAYVAWRRRERDLYGKRENHGLPHHPDGTGWATCPECRGVGETYPEHTLDTCPDGTHCYACDGIGAIWDGGSDPLVTMRRSRRSRATYRDEAAEYAAARALSARHPLGMSQLRMIEAAIRCDVLARDVVARMRAAA